MTWPSSAREEHVARVARGPALDAGADVRRGGTQQRHGLALHVGAHQRAVRVVVLEERDQRGGHRHELLRRHVHVLDLVGGDEADLAPTRAHEHAVLEEPALLVDRRVRLRDDVLVLVVGREVRDLVGDPALLDLAVRRLDEAEPVDPAEGRQVADQADVRSFRRLDRAHAAVVRRVHVTHLEPGALTRQTARSERRQTALVREPRQRVRLVHELRQLRRPEELLDRRDHRPDVDQRLRRDRLDVLRRHALAHDPFHPAQADAELVLDELADGAHPPVAEVVDVVREVAGVAVVQLHEVRDRREDVGLREREVAAAVLDVGVRDLEVEALQAQERVLLRELLRDLVPAHLRLVVALRVEEQVLQQRARRVGGRRLARPELAVDVDERLVDRRGVVLLEGVPHRLVGLALLVGDELEQLLVGLAEPERLEQHGDRLLALPVDAHVHDVALVDLELQPRAAARDHLGVDDLLLRRGLVGAHAEVDAGRPDELRHDDALGAVDDERAAVGHHREVPHEDRLLLDLTGLRVHEARGDEQRARVGHVALAALVLGVLRRVEDVVGQLELELAGEVLDRRDVAHDLRDTLLEEPMERVGLDLDQVREVLDLPQLRKRETFTGRETSQRHSVNAEIWPIGIGHAYGRAGEQNARSWRRRGAPEVFGRASKRAGNFERRERADTASARVARRYAGCQHGSERRSRTPGVPARSWSAQDTTRVRLYQPFPWIGRPKETLAALLTWPFATSARPGRRPLRAWPCPSRRLPSRPSRAPASARRRRGPWPPSGPGS